MPIPAQSILLRINVFVRNNILLRYESTERTRSIIRTSKELLLVHETHQNVMVCLCVNDRLSSSNQNVTPNVNANANLHCIRASKWARF